MTAFTWTTGQPSALNLPQGRLETRCWGPAPDAAPTLVLLHEGLGSVTRWRDFPDRLAAATGFGVFAYSRFGYGRSGGKPLPWPLTYSTDEAVDVLPLVLDAIGFERGILVGHSDGATIAAIHAGTVRDPRIAGAVLMAPHFFTEDIIEPGLLRARKAYEAGPLRKRLARHHDDPDNGFYGWNDTWLRPEIATWNVEHVLPGIAAPVLAIQGIDDEYGTRAQIAAVLRGVPAPVEAHMLPGCGHAPHFEAADFTVGAIKTFAERLLSPAAA